MTPKQFQKYLDRDLGRCIHCHTTETLVPHHRAGRGMGGSKAADRPSNILVICARLNFELEASKPQIARGREFGWRIGKSINPATQPVYDPLEGVWWALGDDYSRTLVKTNDQTPDKIEAGLEMDF